MTDSARGPLSRRYGSAKHPGRPVARERPGSVSSETVATLGKLSEALEAAELDQTLVGRDTTGGQWTFELVEDYDSGYWQVFREKRAPGFRGR